MGNLPTTNRKLSPVEVPVNPINEVQILEGHTDIIRFLIKIDETRIASGSDDGTIILWNKNTGEKIATLMGHSLPITCLMIVERNVIASGSADKTICLWDLTTFTCSKILRGHESSVKCLVSLNNGKFCSGSNDHKMCIWKNDGELIGIIERQEQENLHCLLPIPSDRLVTASNSNLLLVYKTDTFQFHRVLAHHRESVRCLVKIPNNQFASASIDGSIVIWDSDYLIPNIVLFHPENYRDNQKIYIYNVKCLLPIGEHYLAAAIGHGFRVYDIKSKECILECSKKHESDVNALLSLYEGSCIVSASSDACIKIWGTEQQHSFKSKPEKSTKLVPYLIGEMWVHSDCINQLLMCTEMSFASCSNDQTVILWKDGRIESEMRNRNAITILERQTPPSEIEEESTEIASKKPILEIIQIGPVPEPNLSIDNTASNISTQSPQSKSSETLPSQIPNFVRSVRVPDYILDYAENLRIEKQKSIEMISDHLREQGHSESIVAAVAKKQLEIQSREAQ